MALRTRPPTGQVAWPLLLVEGEDHAGKSYAAYELSADPRVGRTFVIDLGEGSADEYAALGPYEVVEHNGTYADLLDQVEAAVDEPTPEPGKPNVIVLDTGTDLWDMTKVWAERRARSSRSNQRKLAEDPDAEIDIPMNIWNDAADRWYRVLNAMRRANTVGVIICRGKEVAKVRGGQPVAGETEYRVEAHKGTPYAVTAQVRFTRPHVATLVAVRSLTVDVPRAGVVLPAEQPLAHLIFDLLGAGPSSVPANIVRGTVGIDRADAKTRLLDRAAELGSVHPRDHALAAWQTVIAGDPPEVTSDQWDGLLVTLGAIVAGQDKFEGLPFDAQQGPAPAAEAPQEDPAPPQDPEPAPEPPSGDVGAAAVAVAEAVRAEVAGMTVAAVTAALRTAGLQIPDGAAAKRDALTAHLTVARSLEGPPDAR